MVHTVALTVDLQRLGAGDRRYQGSIIDARHLARLSAQQQVEPRRLRIGNRWLLAGSWRFAEPSRCNLPASDR